MRIAFIGLGAMGRPMAANLARTHDVLVANRTHRVAVEHAQEHGTTAVEVADVTDVDAVVTCLPVTADVSAVADRIAAGLGTDTLWVDCTSGDPIASRELAARLEQTQVRYVDAPVSGGTNGAEAGTLTVMVGGGEDDVEAARPVLEPMAGRIVHVGPLGAGHAVKAVNNTLLAANLVTVVEGLLALRAMGIEPGRATEVFNHASGRSFATEHPVPERILTGTYDNTFALELLVKDVGLGLGVVDEAGDAAPVLRAVGEVLRDALNRIGPGRDHTEVARAIQRRTGRDLT